MDGLDPDKTLWPQFKSLVLQALDGGKSDRVEFMSDIISDSTGPESRSNVERSLQFAFMDYVLDNSSFLKANRDFIDLRYPTEWWAEARQLQRVVHLHVGPTNSGKTYNALKRLEQARNGFYAGPLRLLAHEVYSRFNNRGIKCDLITGDDVRMDDSGEVELYASTVEMVDSNRYCDVGVIDEIQMMGDNDRGWAWTRAVLSAKVEELHLCGEARVVPLIRELVASMGDTLHIHQYERLNPLKVMSRSLKGNLRNLRKGDCVVAFSVMNIHDLKRQIEIDTGKRCAIIYGALPPETRAQQAALFNDPDNDYDYLVASDAIGMGLNLSVKRIVFETTQKWNGTFREPLSIPQIKQIAGRAGRYKTAHDDKVDRSSSANSTSKAGPGDLTKPQNIGLVTCLDEADLPVLQKALASEGPPLRAAGIFPPGEFYQELASCLPEDTPFEYILRRMNKSVATNQRFKLCALKDQLKIARAIESIPNLPIAARLTICAAPASLKGSANRDMEGILIALAKAIGEDTGVTVADVAEIPLEVLDEPMSAERKYLASLEVLHKSLILYLWLSYRFGRALRDQDMAVRAKELCEEKINATLLHFSANPKLRERLAEMRKSSALLRDQTREQRSAKELATDNQLTMNPDQTVEEIDAAHVQSQNGDGQEEDDVELEEKIEVEGELDIGPDEERGETDHHVGGNSALEAGDQSTETEAPQRAGGSA